MGNTMDILSRIAQRDATPAKGASRLVKRYQVMYSGRASRKVVARAKRLGLDCYLASLTVRI